MRSFPIRIHRRKQNSVNLDVRMQARIIDLVILFSITLKIYVKKKTCGFSLQPHMFCARSVYQPLDLRVTNILVH